MSKGQFFPCQHSRATQIHFLCLYLSTLSDCTKAWTLDELTKKKKRPQIQTELREKPLPGAVATSRCNGSRGVIKDKHTRAHTQSRREKKTPLHTCRTRRYPLRSARLLALSNFCRVYRWSPWWHLDYCEDGRANCEFLNQFRKRNVCLWKQAGRTLMRRGYSRRRWVGCRPLAPNVPCALTEGICRKKADNSALKCSPWPEWLGQCPFQGFQCSRARCPSRNWI